MDAISYENQHYAYVIQSVQYEENALAQDQDELSIMIDPTSGAVYLDYEAKSSGRLEYEQFWDKATAWVSGRFGIILGESMTPAGVRYFSISLDRGGANRASRTIHVYVSRANAAETTAPDDSSFTGKGH